MKTRIIYVLCPDYVTSQCDGQRHFIGADRLASLYGLRLSDCLVNSEEKLAGLTQEQREKIIYLRPQYSGNYKEVR